jgi:cytochrome c
MHDEPGKGGAKAPSPAAARTAGAGLRDHSAHDPFPRWSGLLVGLASLVTTVAATWALYAANPAFQTGKAYGTADQLGQPAAASAGAEPEPGSPAAEGKTLVAAKGCGGCHTIPGCTGCSGTVGPNLAGVAGRTKIAGGAVDNNGPDDLKKWILDPPAAKPGTAMPKLGLSDAEATQIVAYLETLK